MRTAAVYEQELQSSPIVISFGAGDHRLMATEGMVRHRLTGKISGTAKHKGLYRIFVLTSTLTSSRIWTAHASRPIDGDSLKKAVPSSQLLLLAFYHTISHTQRRYGC
jgi:hypothetical protein